MRRIEDCMTNTEAAEVLGVSVDTPRNWDRAGKLKAPRNPMNCYRLYEKADLERVLLSLQASGRGISKAKERGALRTRAGSDLGRQRRTDIRWGHRASARS